MNTARKIKLYRMLTALAYGDAYGMPTEMMSPHQIDFAFPDGVQSLSNPPKNDFFGRPFTAGQTTDDTANAIILTKNIIDNQGVFNQSRYFDALENYVATEPNAAQVVGPSTRAALANRLSGHSLKTCGCLGTTNGCAMKCAPMASIVSWKDKHALINSVTELALPTHGTNVAIMGASMIVAAISRGLSENSFTVEDALETALSYGHRALYTKIGTQMPMPSMYQKCIMALEFCEGAKNLEAPLAASRDIYDYCGCGYETIETIPAVLAVVKLSQGKVSRAARIAAEMGGDTDTIGSIACAICSQIHYDVLPDEVHLLERVNGYQFEKLANDLENATSLPYDVAI